MTQQALDVFQVIADPNRRYILELLTQENLSINALAENFDMSRPAVSKHIKALHTAGFIRIEDIGRERLCMLNQEGFNDLQDWINYFDGFWKTKIKTLETLMNKKK
ncbi:MAG TPA: metalloregulator ArsR/SmtB family transcription factor [Cytophaga sp.]|jgi:DNA-binding transcriptional ArsR family regulator|nr:metalloregulator ArsR/SmtB family transcription factor [Cytophaga sp.]